MTIGRKPTIRLFPLDSDYVAVSAALKDGAANEDNNLYLAVSSPPSQSLNYSGMTRSHHSDFAPFILPNGYYFHDQSYWYSNDPTKTIRHHFVINNISASSYIDSVDHDLDTSLAATLCEKPRRHQILGVNKNRNEVFLYNLNVNNSVAANMRSAVSIFKTDRAVISSITGFPDLNMPIAAIAFNTGEIILGSVEDDKQFNQIKSLRAPGSGTPAKIQLLAAKNGLLIAHDPDKNTLAIWDCLTDECFFIGVYACPEMCNLSISIDGKYLTARELSEHEKAAKGIPAFVLKNTSLYFERLPQELRLMLLQYINTDAVCNGESDLVHCFELNPFKHHPIKLVKPVTDFVIGKDGQVCTARHAEPVAEKKENDNTLLGLFTLLESVGENSCKREFPGSIENFLSPVITDKQEEKQQKKEKKNKHVFSKLTSIFRHTKKDGSERDGANSTNQHHFKK